jgi:hypothetical protein
MIRLVRFISLLASLLMSSSAFALIASVTPAPSSQNVSLNQGMSLPIVWTVVRDDLNCVPADVTVSSSRAIFRTPGIRGFTVLGTVPSTLSQTKACNARGTVVFIFSESVFIPSDVIFRAHSMGLSQIILTRTFSDTSNRDGDVELNITSAGASGFNISRLALSFDNGAPVRVIERKQPLRANAEITFNGSGMMQATWEIADPASTSGEPVFRPLLPVRQYLIGHETQTLESPALPTENPGLHLLRFRITDPAPGFEAPIIRYFVTDQHTRGRRPVAPLGLVTPPNQSLLAPETTFVWEPIPGARAYQLELYAKPRTAGDTLPDLGGSVDITPQSLPPTLAPVTGMLIPGARTRTTLSDTARSRLVSGQRYLWRVLAIGTDGNIVGESPVRELRMP